MKGRTCGDSGESLAMYSLASCVLRRLQPPAPARSRSRRTLRFHSGSFHDSPSESSSDMRPARDRTTL